MEDNVSVSIIEIGKLLNEQTILLNNITEKLQTHDDMFVEIVGKLLENTEGSFNVNSNLIKTQKQIIDLKEEQIEISEKVPIIFNHITDIFGHIERLWEFIGRQ